MTGALAASVGAIVQALCALLLLASGVLAVIGALGVLRLSSFFERAHAVALTPALASWCVALASMLYFSWRQQSLVLYHLAIVLFLAVTVPVSTTLLVRVALVRTRAAGGDAPASVDAAPSAAPGAEPPPTP